MNRTIAWLVAGLMTALAGAPAAGQPVQRSRLSSGSADAPAAVASAPGPGATLDAMSTLDFRKVVSDAKDKVFPAVVYIKVIREGHESGRKISEEAAGSGVLISGQGELLTNWHVVDKAVEVRCLLYDGRAFDATVVGSDKDTDLALVRLKTDEKSGTLPAAVLGDSTVLKEGDFVMAMGAPWGLSRSVSIGIVSATRRYLPDHSEYSLWLQTDAAISPGNSGGPLVNTVGQIIGINTRGVMYGGDMGFAVPSETVGWIVEQLRAHGEVRWGYTGLQLQPLRDFNRNIYFDATEGVMVASTDPESPARRAGLEPRDRIVRVNGQTVTAVTEEDLPRLRRVLGKLELDKPVALDLVRGEQELSVTLTPRQKGKVEGEELDCPRWDLTVKTINQFDNPALHYYRSEGVFIFGIKYPGNASNAGLGRQDILLKVDGQDVKTLDDVRTVHKKSLDNLKTNPRIVIAVLRNGLMRQVVLDISRDYSKE